MRLALEDERPVAACPKKLAEPETVRRMLDPASAERSLERATDSATQLTDIGIRLLEMTTDPIEAALPTARSFSLATSLLSRPGVLIGRAAHATTQHLGRERPRPSTLQRFYPSRSLRMRACPILAMRLCYDVTSRTGWSSKPPYGRKNGTSFRRQMPISQA
jgi:hypothetical protein